MQSRRLRIVRAARRAGRASGAAAAGATVFLASLAGTAATMLARQVVTPPVRQRDPVPVRRIEFDAGTEERGTITLDRQIESATVGEYTMRWDRNRGHARLLGIIGSTPKTVTRRFDGVEGTPLKGVRRVVVGSSPHLAVGDLGLPYEAVEIPVEFGAAPAWWLPARAGRAGDWVVHVHGRGSLPTETLRTVPVVEARGWNSLVITYRNDADFPDGPLPTDAKYGLGLTEWHDVDAALEWAVARGAERIVLVGWSMGGAIVGQTLLNSRFADRVTGVMLESPAVEWRSVLEYQALRMRVPRSVARLGMRILGAPVARWLLGVAEPIDLDALDLVAQAEELRVPLLVLHSLGDTVVPAEGSQRLAAALPERVRYEEFTTARHTRLWNVDADTWERVVGEWFDERSAEPRGDR